MAMMILACWSKEGLVWVIKLFKFVELTADNMLAITNLAICVQLALIVSVSRKRQDRHIVWLEPSDWLIDWFATLAQPTGPPMAAGCRSCLLVVR